MYSVESCKFCLCESKIVEYEQFHIFQLSTERQKCKKESLTNIKEMQK